MCEGGHGECHTGITLRVGESDIEIGQQRRSLVGSNGVWHKQVAHVLAGRESACLGSHGSRGIDYPQLLMAEIVCSGEQCPAVEVESRGRRVAPPYISHVSHRCACACGLVDLEKIRIIVVSQRWVHCHHPYCAFGICGYHIGLTGENGNSCDRSRRQIELSKTVFVVVVEYAETRFRHRVESEVDTTEFTVDINGSHRTGTPVGAIVFLDGR